MNTAATATFSTKKIAALVDQASERVRKVALQTPLQYQARLSEMYQAEIYFKREDLQVVRSYKIRGAYNRMASLSEDQLEKGVVCASAGNHAQGVALACASLKTKGRIYMPVTTPDQKVGKVRSFGGNFVEVILSGDTFDASSRLAAEDARRTQSAFIHPYNDLEVIIGQGTVGREISQQMESAPEVILLPIGGGGLAAGSGSYLKSQYPNCEIFGVEPAGAPAMFEAFRRKQLCKLDQIETFVDGAAVQQVGQNTFPLCQEVLESVLLVPEGKVCSTILKLHNEDGLIVEPAGALSVAALDQLRAKIKGKKVVCVISGGNHDISRTEEIRERSLLYEGLKHYFIIRFPQRAGALREFVNQILGPEDDITHFEYTKKINRQAGPAVVGVELSQKAHYEELIRRMDQYGINYQEINNNSTLFELLV
ncbi:MAG: threonine ammonia-lyase IlvA [Bacteroidetes bacterium]|nr:threonine ammonia-lyase IlvA [Bacteroidota bacterium]